VTQLYPRLLYTFSDVIVFVLKNPRVVESVLERLVKWAAAALEMSSNQPVLPHAIIALNACENNIDAKLWDVRTATEAVFESLSKTVNQNATFKQFAQFWRERGREIDTVEQLMRSYYSTIQVIRIPSQGRPKIIQQQVEKLYNGIMLDCISARQAKAHVRMLLDAEELQSYLQCAFDHFASTLNSPFDFVQASFSNSPIPLDFGGNILKLAINVMEVWQNRVDARTIFEELSYMVASCIMFDSARNKNKGSVEQIFPQYLEHLDAAIENFCDRHWPCEFIRNGGGARCVNVRSGHGSKGHQLADGKVLAAGEYVSSFTFESHHEEFRCNVYFRLQELLERLHGRIQEGEQEELAAASIHRDDVMAWFYRHATQGQKAYRYNSNSVCLSCLFAPPEHALPCGHILCTACVKAYGDARGTTAVDMYECPIERATAMRYQSWRIHFKPKTAGIRVLTLDGGGIRGIAELEVLRAIELEMGAKLPIQCFFDFIVGTSTGGIIALGLAAKDWSVEDCIEYFETLCNKAFTRRTGVNLPGIGWIVENYNHSRYETCPLEEALMEAFTDDQTLFGGRRPNQSTAPRVKVAVTAVSAATSTAVVMANYNRRCTEKLSYQFLRPERFSQELKIWEAARSTAAAPKTFKPYYHEASKQTYLDGALWHNNPINIADRERKLIWPELREDYPDIVVSVGTTFSSRLHRQESERAAAVATPRRGVYNHISALLKIAKDHVFSSFNSERIWIEFKSGIPKSVEWSRFVRLNPELTEDPPLLDEVHKMKALQSTVRSKMAQDACVKRLALQLLATSFYFELAGPISETDSGLFEAQGRICCRLPQETQEIGELGKALQAKSAGRTPFFLIHEQDRKPEFAKKIKLDWEVLDSMIRDCQFKLKKVAFPLHNRLAATEISLCFDDGQAFPISGFPRMLIRSDSLSTSRSGKSYSLQLMLLLNSYSPTPDVPRK